MRLLIVGLLAFSSAWAQQTTATIAGTISDESGAVLPGVQVTITNKETGNSRAVTTDERGYYVAPLLPVGSYQTRSELPGFQTAVQTGLTLVVGALANAFAPPQPGLIGNSGRNILIGPGLLRWDFSIGKQFPLQFIREDAKLEFRAEAFNVTNHVNYANPDPRQSFFAGTSPNDPVVASGTFSPRTKTPSRQLQFGLRLSF